MEMYSRADHDRRYDFLTGLYSRLSLNEYLENVDKKQTNDVLAAIMVDLDDFKGINDRYGHPAGDKCLSTLGKMLLDFGVSRGIDFYRYGGDEFVGLLKNPGEDIKGLEEDLLNHVRKLHVVYGDVKINLSACVGITQDGTSCRSMIIRADQAMYLAKHNGKNQGCIM